MLALGQRQVIRRPKIIAAGGCVPENALSPSTTKLQGTSRLLFAFGAPARYVRFAFDSWTLDTAAPGYTDLPTSFTIVKVAMEYNGLARPVTFTGQRSVTLQPGLTRFYSDRVYAGRFNLSRFPADDYGWFRGSILLPSSSGRFPTAYPASYNGVQGAAMFAYYDPANHIDQIDDVGDMVLPSGASVSNFGWGPSAIVGDSLDRSALSAIAVTDSIGWRDDPDATGGPAEVPTGVGFVSRAACAADGSLTNVVAVMRATKVGGTVGGLNNERLGKYYQLANMAIEEDATNSLGSGGSGDPTTIHDLLTVRRNNQRSKGVRKIARTKLLPRTSSASGKWNGDQTYVANWGAGGNAGTLNGLFDADFAAGRIEALLSLSGVRGDISTSDPYRWKEDGTDNYATIDGTHPFKALQIVMANELRRWFAYLKAGYPADIAAWAAACTVEPSASRIALMSSLKSGLVSAGSWSLLDLLHFMGAHDEQAGRLALNKAGNFTLAPAGSPNFVTDRGFDGDSTDAALNTAWAPSTNGVNFTRNAASLIWGAQGTSTSSVPDLGTVSGVSGNRNVSLIRSNGTNAILRLNDNADTTFPNTSPKGIYLANRSGTTVTLWKIGPTGAASMLGSATVASTAASPAPLNYLRGPGTTQWSAATGAFVAAVGGDLTGKEAATLAAIRDAAVAVGAFS